MFRDLSSRFWQWLAYHLPAPLVYHASIRAWAYATTGEYSYQIVPELTASDMVRRWEAGHKKPPQYVHPFKPIEGVGAVP